MLISGKELNKNCPFFRTEAAASGISNLSQSLADRYETLMAQSPVPASDVARTQGMFKGRTIQWLFLSISLISLKQLNNFRNVLIYEVTDLSVTITTTSPFMTWPLEWRFTLFTVMFAMHGLTGGGVQY